MPSLYTRLRAAVDGPLRRLTNDRLYVSYTLRGEHVTTVRLFPMPLHDTREFLRQNGYEPAPFGLESAKRNADGQLHDLALRRVDPEHPRRQYHVHGFQTPDGLQLMSHMEYRPDPVLIDDELPSDAYARLREHYRPSHGPEWGDGTTYVPGAYDDVLARLAD